MKTIYCSILFFLFAFNGFSQSYKMEGNELVFDESIRFKSGTAELSPENQKTLNALKDFLNEKKYVTLLRIEGHVGGKQLNLQGLSEKRAIAITKWLITEGIDCKRLIAVGFGDSKPIIAPQQPAAAENNTRIVFAIAALRDKLIGGMSADGGGQISTDPCKISK